MSIVTNIFTSPTGRGRMERSEIAGEEKANAPQALNALMPLTPQRRGRADLSPRRGMKT